MKRDVVAAADGQVVETLEVPESLRSAMEQSGAMRDTTASDRIEAAIREWFFEHIHGSPIAMHTEAYNHLYESLSALKEKLVGAL